MRALVVVEVQETPESMFPGAWPAEGAGVETLLVQGAVGTLHFAVLLGHGHREKLEALRRLAEVKGEREPAPILRWAGWLSLL